MRAREGGFTVIEIVVVLAIAGLLAGFVSDTLSRQQRLFRATSGTIEVRRGVRDAISVLTEEIRGAAPRDTIRLMADSAIELFTSLGGSVLCTSLGAADIGLAPASATSVSLTSWLAVPDTGDLALIYRAASSTAGTWERYRIRAVATRATAVACPAQTGLSGGVGASISSYVVTLSPSPPVARAGSPVRFIRRGRYSLYRSSDSRWYLGYRRCNAIGPSSCGTIQPLSGYYQPYSSDTTRTGLLFRYFDSSNRSLGAGSDPLRIARVQLFARSVSPAPLTLDGVAKTPADSAAASASLRNCP